MNTALIVITVLVSIIGLLMVFTNNSRPYTNEEWEEQSRKDFQKFGPVPDECYKANQLCKYNCKGLCKDSC